METLARKGVRLEADGDRLVVQAGAGVLDDGLAAAIREHKPRLLEVLHASQAGERAPQGPRPLPPGSPVVASPGQRRYWELHRLAPEPSVLNVPGAFRLSGPLDVDALRYAIEKLVERHDILRSRFSDGAEGPEIRIESPAPVPLPVDDLSHVPAGELEAALRHALESRADEPMDLEAGPPIRVRLLHLGPDDHALLFVAHSLVWDGWSFDILLTELAAHYEARIGLAPPAPELPLQYADVAAWQNRRLASGEAVQSLAYWKEQMAGAIPSLELPMTDAGGRASGYAGARRWFKLAPEVVDGVRALARSERTTPYAVLLAAFKALLHRYAGVDDVVVASPLYGRDRPELESLVGVFANTLFLRTAVDAGHTFRELVHRVRATTADAVAHQATPTEQVAALLREGSGARSPYEALFVFQQTARRPSSFGPVAVQSIRRGTRRVAVDLTVWVREYDDYIDGAFDFRTELFDDATIEVMKAHFQRILLDGVSRPDATLASLALAEDGDLDRVAGSEDARSEALLRAVRTRLESGQAHRARLVDRSGVPAPIHVMGEIHVADAGESAEWTPTGIRARWTARGELEVLTPPGRPEPAQPELAELVRVLEEHPDVAEAAAVAQPTAGAAARIVAYVVWNTEFPPFDSEIRSYIGAALPRDLIPAMTLSLEVLPRDPAGDVQTSELPNPFAAEQRGSEVAERSDTEEELSRIWMELLELDEVHPDDNFFALGGHSLLAVEAVAEMERRFGTRIVARDTFFMSLRQIAARIDEAMAAVRR
jgi:acyl carrier protein